MEPSPQKEIFGMSVSEIGIFAVLLVVILVVGGFFLKTVLDTPSRDVVRQSSGARRTPTPFPSFTPSPEPPPTTPTPIPGWHKFTFASPPGEIWLPEGYEGGDTITDPEIVMLSAEVYIDEQLIIDDFKTMIELPGVCFFAFDPKFKDVIRFVVVMSEPLDSDSEITMYEYMDTLVDDARFGGSWVVDRNMVQLDRYKAGRLVVENKIPVENKSVYVHLAVYSIRIENTMWNIAIRTSRDEFIDYLPVMNDIANSFQLYP